jgi:hypothetical protein
MNRLPQVFSAAIMARLVLFPLAHAYAHGFSFLGLGHMAEGIPHREAHSVSATGSVIVGFGRSASGREAFR